MGGDDDEGLCDADRGTHGAVGVDGGVSRTLALCVCGCMCRWLYGVG